MVSSDTFRWNPGCRCCCHECIVLSDDFARADSTNLGSDWVEELEDSEIISGELSIPADGIVITTADTSDDDSWMQARAKCLDLQPGKIYRVIVNWNDDDETYYCAELECAADSVAYLRVCSGIGSVVTLIRGVEITYTAGQDAPLVACRTLEGIYATTTVSTTAWGCVSDNDGRKAGLSNGSNTDTIEFDDFIFLRGEGLNGLGDDPTQTSRCFFCECECSGQCLPDTLTLTFEATDLCACLDGVTITLTLDVNSDHIIWRGSATVGSWDSCSYNATAEFVLECDLATGASSGAEFTLWNNGHPVTNGWTAGANFGMTQWVNPNTIDCDPFQLDFGTFIHNISPGDPPVCGDPPLPSCDCNLDMIITE